MAPSIGLNLRVTGYCNQGGRKYMEDVFSVAYQQTEDEKDLEYAFFGIFDGHGGREAAVFAKEHLMDFIVKQKGFWAEDDQSVLRAIHEGFVQTHQAMWRELEKWPKTMSGLPSTAGTTASIAFIRRSKIYVGHVGDSAIILGTQDSTDPGVWKAEPLTKDHKPESIEETRRIEQSGGKVVCKSGVPRVVWNRPKMGHKGPVRRSTHMDEIPFLAVARSLGDLWSYNSEEDVFVVSPEPDTFVYPIDISRHRCLILGTDGAWNMLNPAQAVYYVCQAEKSNEQHMLNPQPGIKQWINPSKYLVDWAIERWTGSNLRADNTSVVTVMLDPPGPPRAQVLKRQRSLLNHQPANHLPNPEEQLNDVGQRGSVAMVTNTLQEEPTKASSPAPIPGMSIVSRYPNSTKKDEFQGRKLSDQGSKVLHDFQASRRFEGAVLSPKSKAALARLKSDFTEGRTEGRKLSEDISERKVLKESRMSRELSALKLDSPMFNGTPTTRTRYRSGKEMSSTSDTENEEDVINRLNKKSVKPEVPSSSQRSDLEDTEVQFNKLTHRLRRMESKIAQKTEQLKQEVKHVQSKLSKSRRTPPPPPVPPRLDSAVRSLRPRSSIPSSSPRKRKSSSTLGDIEPAKSPKTVVSSASSIMRRPVMTRARKARVLSLKK